MSSTKFYRLSGMFLIVAAVLYISVQALDLFPSIGEHIYTAIVDNLNNIITFVLPTTPYHSLYIPIVNSIGYAFDQISVLVYILMLCGVFGPYLCQRRQVRILGLLGFLSILLGFLCGAATLIYDRLVIRPAERVNVYNAYHNSAYHIYTQFTYVATSLICIGSIVFGIFVLRARVFSSIAGILLLIGGIMNTVAVPIYVIAPPTSTLHSVSSGIAIFGIMLIFTGFALMGYALFAQSVTDEVKTVSPST